MHGYPTAFFSLKCGTLLVIRGRDDFFVRDDEAGEEQHTVGNVYPVMLLQICAHYPGLPDVRTLRMREIRFFYNGIRDELKTLTKPKS